METGTVTVTWGQLIFIGIIVFSLAWIYTLLDKRLDKADRSMRDFRNEVDLKLSKVDDKIEHLRDRVGKVKN